MEKGEKKKKETSDEFRWVPEELDDSDEPDPDVSHVDFLSADGPLRLVSVLDEFGNTLGMSYEIPPPEAPIWIEWHQRQIAKQAFALVE